MVCVKSGYKTVTPIQFANCLKAEAAGEIDLRAVRVFFGCLASVAIRDAAARVAKRKGRKPCSSPRYLISELSAVTELSERAVRKGLRELTKASLIRFTATGIEITTAPLPETETLCFSLAGKRSPKRPIPVPRAVLRFLARSTRKSISKTLIAYVLRGLSLDRRGGTVRSAGTVKASWIARSFSISARSAKSARKELIEMGLISKDTGSYQRKLNRDGAYFRLNLEWTGKRSREGAQPPKFSPRLAKTHPEFAPPYKTKKTSYESKTQKSQSRALRLPGVCKANTEKPTLRDVKTEDLKRYSRLRVLFEEAVARKWVQNTEPDFLNWISAAVRAQTVQSRSPVRVFVAIVRGRRWELITQAQEDRARAAILRNRQHEEGKLSGQKSWTRPENAPSSLSVLLKKGGYF